MRILTDLIDKMDDTLDEIEWYTEKAHMLRTEHKALADCYIKVAEMHIDIYKMLHDRAVVLIEEQKKIAPAPPNMMAIWEYEHSRLIKEFNEVKYSIEEYKKSY